MPRPFLFNLQDLLKFARAKEVQVESHSTLQLTTTATNTTERIFWLATAKLTINGIAYKGALKEVGAIRQSITRATNRTEVVITNLSSLVDGDVAPFIPVPPRGQPFENLRLLLGADLINKPNEILGAEAVIGRYWKNLDTGQEFHEILFRGVVQNTQADQNDVRLQILSDIFAASIGGGRRVARKCQWRFRDANTCAYTGVELACNKLLNSTGGCSGRTNEHHYGGFAFIQPKSSVSGPAAVGAPPRHQVIRSYNGTTYASQQQQNFIAFENATFTNDNTNEATRVYPGALAEATVIPGANPSLEFRDTDASAPDYKMELNAGVFSQRFIGGSTMLAMNQAANSITVQSGVPFNADTIHAATGINVTSSGETTPGLEVVHTQSTSGGADFSPLKLATTFTGVIASPLNLGPLGILSSLTYGSGGTAAQGTCHTFTSTLDVVNSTSANNEFANYMGWGRLGSAAQPETGSLWFGDFSLMGSIGIQPGLLNGIVMLVNNFFNGQPSRANSAAFLAITKPGQGAGGEGGHNTSQSYPNEAGVVVAGWSGESDTTPTTRGWNKGVQVGGSGSAWMTAGERSLIGTGVDVADCDTNAINLHDPRGTGVTGIKISTDSVGDTWGWLFDATALVDGDIASTGGALRLPGLNSTKGQIVWGSDSTAPILFRNADNSLVLVALFTLDNAVTDTTTVANVFTSNANSTGTPGVGFGQSHTYRLESSTTVNRDAARMSVSWVTAADADRTSVIDFATVDDANALRNVLRVSGNGVNTGCSYNLLGTNGTETRGGVVTELITLNTGSTTTDTTIDLPAGSIIDAITTRVVTTITTATTFSVGDNAGNASRFSAAAGPVTSGSTRVCLDHWNPGNTAPNDPRQASAAKVRITTDANPGAGAIRISIHYVNFIPPTG